MLSLKHAYLRIDRANEHLGELTEIHDAVCAAQSQATTIKTNMNVTIQPDQAVPIIMVEHGDILIPDRISILIGETIYNLRSALDYLVNRLARLHSGDKERGTQFPIESTKDGFGKRKDTFLQGVNNVHVAAIEKLQPYNGCEWTGHLRDMSNPDKHNDLIVVTHDCLVRIDATTIDSTESESVELQMHMNLQPVLSIRLRDGLPVVETLEILQSQVSQVLDSFNPLFQ